MSSGAGRFAPLGALLLLGAGPASAAEPAPAPPPPLAARVESYLAPVVASRDFSGVVLMARGRQVLFEGAWGRASYELDVPITPDTRFDVASLTKTFTAAAILQLVAAGRLALDDPLERTLPGLPGADRITIEMLLLHQSGLPEEAALADYESRRFETLTLAEAVERFEGAALDFEPGTDGAYSNTGYLVLARVVEIVSGEAFEVFLERSLVRPLGMLGTGIDLVDPIVPGKARGYEPGPPPHRLLGARPDALSHHIGSGALYSTARDLHRWLVGVDAGELFALFDQRYPYGWGRREYFGRRAVEQSGIVSGYLAEMILFPDDDLMVVYLSNIQSGVVFGRLLRGLSAIALGAPAEPLRPPPPPADEAPREVAGTFRLPGPGELSIVPGPGGLYLRWHRFGSRAYLAPLGPDRFFVRKDNAEIAIRRDGRGRAQAVIWNPGPDELVAPRVEE